MELTIEEIRSSGLLELYVLDDLSKEEALQVKKMLIAYPELMEDIISIENAYTFYGMIHSSKPPKGTYSSLLNELNMTPESALDHIKAVVENESKRWWYKLLWPIIGLILLIWGIQKLRECEAVVEQGRSSISKIREKMAIQESQLDVYKQLIQEENVVINAHGVGRFRDADANFYYNDNKNRTYLHIKNLPTNIDDSFYQLWAVCDNDKVIPLDRFHVNSNAIIETRHIDIADSYIITLESGHSKKGPSWCDRVLTFDFSICNEIK